MKDLQTLITQLRDLLENGKTKDALRVLLEVARSNKKFNNEVILLNSRFERAKSQFHLGVITESEYNKEINKINLAVLNFIDEIPTRNEREIGVNKKKRNVIILIVTILLVAIMFFWANHNNDNNNSKIDFQVYQITSKIDSTANFNDLAFKYLISELNERFKYFEIIIQEPREVNYEDMITSKENFSIIVSELNKIHPDQIENEVVIAMIDFPLNSDRYSNLFSNTRSDYSVFSIWGLSLKDFEPKNYDSFILRYMLIEIFRVGINNQLLKKNQTNTMHESGRFKGCIFDFMENKLEIINSINSAKLCDDHEEMIRENLGDEKFEELKNIISFNWIDDEIQTFMKNRYSISI